MRPDRAPVSVVLIAIAVAAVLVAVFAVRPALADPPPGRVIYRAPVPGPVIDPYRPPSTPYGPGNRGIDYATTPGENVVAPADGEVTFAGAVGGGLHVVLLHADGIRTSLSFLADVVVRRGQRVAAGDVVGRAAASLHFGARRGEAYLDPATLLAGGASGGRAMLVPEGAGRPLAPGDEAAGLRRLLAGDRPARSPAAATPSPVAPVSPGAQRVGFAPLSGAPPGPTVLRAAPVPSQTVAVSRP